MQRIRVNSDVLQFDKDQLKPTETIEKTQVTVGGKIEIRIQDIIEYKTS